MSKLDNLYKLSPIWMQNVMVSVYGAYWRWLRLGGSFRSDLQAYQAREWFDSEQWRSYTQQKLNEILQIAYHHVPHYSENWSQSDFDSAMNGELAVLPLLEKNPIRLNPESFRREDKRVLPELAFHTSGTTGTPIKSFWSISEYRNAMALREARSANWAGVSFKLPRATFSGRMVEPQPERITHVYRFNRAESQVYFSAFHLKPQTAPLYVEALKKHKIVWMTGYAVSFYLLAKHILDQNIPIPELRAIITTSEKLTPKMREVMEEAYQCRVFEEYSTVENALFANECLFGRLHVSPDASMIEILRPDGTPCDPGEVGEVVTTCLIRDYQPLIRFKLGDLAAWDPEPCPCGRQMPVIKEVVGRIEDVVTGPDGRQLVRFHGIFTDQQNIIEGQIIQEALDLFTVKVVPGKSFGEDDVLNVQQRMVQRLGSKIKVKVEIVPEIPRSASGKFQAVISRVDK